MAVTDQLFELLEGFDSGALAFEDFVKLLQLGFLGSLEGNVGFVGG